jgi:Replication-relaxation
MSGRVGIPVGVPVVWPNQGASRLVDGESVLPRAATMKRSQGSASSRTGRQGLDAVRGSLSARDWAVLEGVGQHRYLTTGHIEGFWFHDHATPLAGARVCRRVLLRLADLRVVDHLERRIGGVRAGSKSYVWQVGPVGDRLLREGSEHPRSRQREPGLLFLKHCLAVADAHLTLVRTHRRAELELVRVQTEPECWRPYTGVGGARLILQPDLYVETGDPTDPAFVNCWFVEVDRGTESLARLLAKCQRYETYRRTGSEQAATGGFPLVAWVMREPRHAERLAAAIHRNADLDDQLFRVTTADQFIGAIREGAA